MNGEHAEYEAQVALARKAYPMRTFKQWAEETQGAAATREKNLNQVTLWKLMTGKQ
jgi:hypothetical protein